MTMQKALRLVTDGTRHTACHLSLLLVGASATPSTCRWSAQFGIRLAAIPGLRSDCSCEQILAKVVVR